MSGDAGRTADVFGALLRTVDEVDPTKANFVRSIDGKVVSIGYHWNTGSLDYEVNTGGTSSGSDVNVTNFPATQAATQSGTWTVQQGGSPWAVSQGGTWNIGTVTTVTGVTTVSTVTGVTTVATVTNLSQMSGAAIAMGTGTRSAGTQRVTVATDDVVPVTNANLDATISSRLKPADTLTGVTTVAAVTSITNPVAVTSAGLTNIDVALSTRLKPADTLTGVTTVGTVTTITNAVPVGTQTTAFNKTITYVSVAQGAAGTTVLAVASASNKHKIMGAVLTMSAAGSLQFTDGVGNLSGAMDIGASGGFVLPTSLLPFVQTSTTNTELRIVTITGAAKGFVAILTEP